MTRLGGGLRSRKTLLAPITASTFEWRKKQNETPAVRETPISSNSPNITRTDYCSKLSFLQDMPTLFVLAADEVPQVVRLPYGDDSNGHSNI
jgi:hypothetical protein